MALPGKFFEHYYQLWLPPLSVGAACGLLAVAGKDPATGNRRFAVAAAALVFLLMAAQAPYYTYPPAEWSSRKFGPRLLNNTAVAGALNRLLRPGETFVQWGHYAELYYYSGRRPPIGEFRSEYLLDGPRSAPRQARVIEDLSRQHPELLVVSRKFPFPPERPVPRWLLEHYAPFPPALQPRGRFAEYRLYYRRGGAVAARLFSPSGKLAAREQGDAEQQQDGGVRQRVDHQRDQVGGLHGLAVDHLVRDREAGRAAAGSSTEPWRSSARPVSARPRKSTAGSRRSARRRRWPP